MTKRILVLAATAASALALTAVPASASCTSDPTVPGCVNYAITTAENGVQTVLNIYNNVVQPEVNVVACVVLHAATGKPC